MATPGLLKELERAEEVLGELKSRYYLLRAFQEEVDARIGRRKIPIQNDHAWRMAFDTRDALTIHLASWAKRALSSGGLFGQLKASLGALYVPKAKSKAIGPQSRRELFERLFPGAASRGKVLPSDIDVLTDRYVDVGLARPKRRMLANKPLKQTAAPRRDHQRLPLARGEVPRARSSPPAAFQVS
jgi:hypothetical protein